MKKMIKLSKITLDDYINYIFLLYAFLLPLSRAGITILTALLFVLWLFTADFKKKITFLKSNKIAIYLFAFIALSLLSLVWSDNVSSGLYYIRKYWYYLTIFVIATSVHKKYIKYAITAFLSGMFISEMLSYGIFFELFTFKNVPSDNPTPFMNHLQYSMFLAFTSLLLLNRYFYEERLKYKILYLLYFLTVTTNLFINAGRTGQVAFFIALFVLGLLNIKRKLLSLFIMLTLSSSILFVSYQVSPVFKSRIDVGVKDIKGIYQNEDYSTSIGLRIGAWTVGSEIFMDNPLLGTGVTNDMNKMREYITNNHPEMQCVKIMPSYHNYYVHTAVRLGIIGLFLYLMIFYSILKLEAPVKENSNLKILFVVVYMISSLFENMFHEQFSEAFFAFFVGVFIAQSRFTKENKYTL